MLILTRRIGESLIIECPSGDNEKADLITVVILEVQGQQVRLGVSAPRDIPVHREEVYNRIKLEDARSKATSKGKTINDDHLDDHNALIGELTKRST